VNVDGTVDVKYIIGGRSFGKGIDKKFVQDASAMVFN